jgi:hypothetical protein
MQKYESDRLSTSFGDPLRGCQRSTRSGPKGACREADPCGRALGAIE